MAVSTAEEFLNLVEKSELLNQEQLAQARGNVRQGEDVTTLAKRLVEAELLSDWQAAQILAGRSSFLLGKYKLIRLLGRGGMGGVFLAEHTMMNRRVALKTISRDFGSTPGSLEQFLLEARTIAALDHPNIVQAYSFDQEGGRFFLVMEYVDGQDLEQIVEAQGTLDGNVAADYIRQAAEGLQHGHERKIIHCDIKPSNLLLGDNGVVKIVDMGMSRLQDPDKKETDSNEDQILGSVDYLAPEQAIGSKDFDHRADIYSLGCTLYFLLTGRPPFPEGMLHEKLMKHQAVDPEPITKFRTDVSDKVIEVCEKMMAKEPGERYQSAEEVGKAMSRLPAPKRKAKPAALRKAAPLPEPASEAAPLIDVGAETSSVMARMTPRAGATAAARKEKSRKGSGKESAAEPGFLATPQGKIIAVGAAGAALLLLLAILIPFLTGSGKKPPDEPGKEIVTPGEVPPIEPVTPVDPIEPGSRNLVFDFETGDSQGWRVVEGESAVIVSDRAKPENNPDEAYNKQGKFHLTTKAAGWTGVIESPVFVLSEPKISMLVGGTSGSKTYVTICTLDDKEQEKFSGEGTAQMRRIEWDFPQLVGKPIFLRVIDGARRGGYTLLDDFQATGHFDSAATEKRFAGLPPITPPPPPTAGDLAQGMVAHFPFDTGAGESVGGGSGTLQGGAAIATDSQRGPVLNLDGNGSFVLLPDFTKPAKAMTGAAWVHAKSRPVWASIMKNWASDKQTGLFHFGLRENTGELDIQLGTTQGEVVVTESVPFDTGAWQHVAFTADGMTLRLYRNGKEVGSLPYSGDLARPSVASLAIGAKTDDTGTAADSTSPGFWDGMIDDARLYDRALSASEIAALAVPGETSIVGVQPVPPEDIAGTDPPADKPPKTSIGVIIHEMWTDIEGGKVQDLVNSGRMDTEPDVVRELTSFKAPGGIGDRYGVRIRGYIHPPVDGDYKFFIASDDEGHLYLSDDDHPDGKFRVHSGQSIALKAGERYYIEVLQKEGGGGDHVSVQWQRPDGTKEVIPGNCLSPFAGGELADVNFLTFDFEKGNLQGWKVVYGTFQQIVSSTDRRNRQGQYHLDTLEGGREGQIGIVESPVFLIEGTKIHLRVGGGSGGQTVVKLMSLDETELCTAHGQNRDQFDSKTWDVTDWVGQRAFLRVEDTLTSKNGYVLLDQVRIRGQIDRRATEDRFGQPLKVPDHMPIADVEAEQLEPPYEAFKTLGRTAGLAVLETESPPKINNVLGKLALAEGETVDLELLGGANAIRGARQFKMAPVEDNGVWRTIYLVSDVPGSNSSQPKAIARIGAKDGTIVLQWPQTLDPDESNCLLNCGLNISVGHHSHFLPLAPPQIVEPVPVTLEKAIRLLPSGHSPERESVRLEVVRIEGLPAARCEPSNVLKPSGEAAVKLPSWFFPGFSLLLEFDLKKPSVSVVANIMSDPNLSAKPFRTRDAARAVQMLQAQQTQLLRAREQTKDGNRHKEIDALLNPINNRLAQFTSLNELYTKLKTTPGKIHFRVFTIIDDEHRVILMQSFPFEQSSKAGPSEDETEE